MVSGTTKWTLYALELEKGKWFVDVTTGDPEAQLKKHKSGDDTEWTKRFAPVKIAYSHEIGEVSEEDALKYAGKLLRKYMEHYGEGNVRVGDLPSTTQKGTKKQKYGEEKKGFRIWNTVTQIIVIFILLGIIAYLLLDKFYLTPSTALTIIQ